MLSYCFGLIVDFSPMNVLLYTFQLTTHLVCKTAAFLQRLTQMHVGVGIVSQLIWIFFFFLRIPGGKRRQTMRQMPTQLSLQVSGMHTPGLQDGMGNKLPPVFLNIVYQLR